MVATTTRSRSGRESGTVPLPGVYPPMATCNESEEAGEVAVGSCEI